jgi:hypothetical protein
MPGVMCPLTPLETPSAGGRERQAIREASSSTTVPIIYPEGLTRTAQVKACRRERGCVLLGVAPPSIGLDRGGRPVR